MSFTLATYNTEITCAQPADVDNGQVTVTALTFSGTYTVTCESGYELIGSDTRSCVDLGSWDGTDPYCRGNCNDYINLSSFAPGSLYYVILYNDIRVEFKNLKIGSSYFK